MLRRAKHQRGNPHLAQDRSGCALLLIDVIQEMRFPGSEGLLRRGKVVAQRIEGLRARCARQGIPTVYVNDNFGRWRSDMAGIVRRCMRATCQTREIVERLAPRAEDYLVVKPQNSGFYSTVLETLLRHIGVRAVILAGFATDNCVLFTAQDAYLRGFEVFVPEDCSTAVTPAQHRQAVALMARNLKADVRASRSLRLAPLARPAR